MKFIYSFFILLFLFSPIISIAINDIEEIKFDGISFSSNFSMSEPLYFKIIFESQEVTIPEYLKIELINLDNTKNPNLAIAFSTQDQNCLDREQLSYGISKTQMWLTKEQLLGNMYINLICSSNSCNIQLKLDAYNTIEMDFNSQFNLYVTENNKKIEIMFDPSSESEVWDYITIWAIGNKKVEINFEEDEFEYATYTKNNILKVKKSNANKSSFLLSILGEVGDIINIGSSTTFANNYNNLIINNPETKGLLLKAFSNEDCYEFIKDKTYENSKSFYLTGIIHSKIAEIFYKNKNGEEIPNSVNIIRNGSFIEAKEPTIEDSNYFCIRFPTSDTDNYNINEIFYSLQLTDPRQSEYKLGLYSPQIYGEQYPRILPEGEEFSYLGVPPNESSHQISIDMIAKLGFPDLYYRLCKNFPICSEYEEIDPKSINGHSTQKIQLEYRSPMSPNQYLLYVKCLASNDSEAFCSFKTSFNSDVDKIQLKENEPFSQFILKGEKDLYKLDYSGEKKIKKIYVDLILFTGDVNFNTDSKLNAKKLFNSNKIFYTIIIDEQTSDNQEIEFSVDASKNSYYTIEFTFIREDDDSWLTNIIEPGISYLITIDPEAEDSSGTKKPYKIVKFSNLRNQGLNTILVQFYSLNCKLNVTAKRYIDDQYHYEEIDSFDQYYQDIVNTTNDYEYMLYIKETDSSNYNNKLCMVYSSSLELNYNKNLDERQIVISNNEPKQIAFTTTNREIEYLYPNTNKDNDIIINFNLLDFATYKVIISCAHKQIGDYTQTGNDLIYLNRYEWRNICKENEICPIIIKITFISYFEDREPKLLISVKSVQDSTPAYLTKNMARSDFLLGNNWQYYYTDLGENEDGDVIVNYRRGSGRLFGKIVQKNAEVPEEDADWREMYKFPKTPLESLEFFGYIKKIMISKEDTKKCKDGCYLLLSLKTSIVTGEKIDYDFREHPFNIIIHTRSSNEIKDIPIVNIPLSEYIIGNLYTHEDNNIYEYYSAIFTHNSNKISIDFQSKVVNLYINVGANNKPKRNEEPDFQYVSNGQDSTFDISTKEFLDKCKEKGIEIPYKDSLLGLSMTIGLWTDKTDSLYTTVYSMKIHLPFDESLDIYEVNSDQKTLCKTQRLYGENRCLFMVFYYGIDSLNHLFLYPMIQNHSPYTMSAYFIKQENYEYFDYSYFRQTLNSNPDYTTKDTKLDYLYIEHGRFYDNFIFLIVDTTEPTTVELLSSFYTFDLQISPNPSSPQLFLVKNDHFLFEFPTNESLIISLQSICGEGSIYWEVDDKVQYNLFGKEQKISLTNSLIDQSNDTLVFSNLYVKNKNLDTKSTTCPGFAFYISYLLRPPTVNLDEITMGRSTQIAYRNTDLPVYFYSQLRDLDKDTNIFVNLYELIGDNYLRFTSNIPFEISATLVNNSFIMSAKLEPTLLDNLNFEFKGIYDSMIKTAFVLIKKNDIKKKEFDPSDGLSIFVKVSKNKDYPQLKNFTRVNLEASVIQDNSTIPVVSDIYQYGKLSLSSNINIYKLKTDKTKKFMRIHYSPNSKHTKYSISFTPGSKKNSALKDMTNKFINGKSVITFNSEPEKNPYIYLNIFHNDDEKAKSEKTTNYAFKYMNSDDIKNFKLYELPKEEGFQLNTKKDGKKYDYTFTISPLLPQEKIDITYFIKFVKRSDWAEGEGDNCIALRESTSLVEELTKIEMKDEKIIKKYEKIDEIDYRYVQVIALVKDNGNIEYVGYQSIYKQDSRAWKIVLIILAAIIVFIIVIYLINIYIQRKRNLSGKIKKISGPVVSRFSEAPSIE